MTNEVLDSKITAYKAVLSAAKKHVSALHSDNIVDVDRISVTIRNLELSKRFGVPLRNIGERGWHLQVCKGYDNYTALIYFGEGGGTIGFPDNGKQPKNEWLFKVSLRCGPYIFGDSYPTETFTTFFQELKSFGPAFCDTANSSLYFRDDVSEDVYDNFWTIFNKYKALVQDEVNAKRKQSLIDELAKLNENE